MICQRNAVRNATSFVNHILPSVIVIARVLSVKPEALAKALRDKEANAEYFGLLASAMTSIFVKEEVERSKQQ